MNRDALKILRFQIIIFFIDLLPKYVSAIVRDVKY